MYVNLFTCSSVVSLMVNWWLSSSSDDRVTVFFRLIVNPKSTQDRENPSSGY